MCGLWPIPGAGKVYVPSSYEMWQQRLQYEFNRDVFSDDWMEERLNQVFG